MKLFALLQLFVNGVYDLTELTCLLTEGQRGGLLGRAEQSTQAVTCGHLLSNVERLAAALGEELLVDVETDDKGTRGRASSRCPQ